MVAQNYAILRSNRFSYEKEQGLHTEGHTEDPGNPKGSGKGTAAQTQAFYKEKVAKPKVSTRKGCEKGFQEPSRTRPIAHQNHAQSMPESCPQRAKTMLRACHNQARSASEPGPKHAITMPGSRESRSSSNPCEPAHARAGPATILQFLENGSGSEMIVFLLSRSYENEIFQPRLRPPRFLSPNALK